MSRLTTSLLLALALSQGLTPGQAQTDQPSYTRQEDVIYGRKYGTALTMDVFTPKENARGVGLIFVVSGGWFSAHEVIPVPLIEPFVERGYTVFAVVHGSQPKFTIPEILEDMNRAVRFIRFHAEDYGIDPDRLGIYGGSAGGHLSLMQGLAGGPGKPDAKDPVDQTSSRVQAVACLYPPTDFLNYGKPGENALGRGILQNFQAPFDFHTLDRSNNKFVPVTDEEEVLAIGRAIAPITHVSEDDPPTLILHGDADKLVPIQQAEILVEKLKQSGVEAKLVVKPGAAHGWPDVAKDMTLFADWFDEHLAKDREQDQKNGDARPETSSTSRADAPPRKVVVGTAIFGPYGDYPGLDDRLKTLSDLIDRMARQADEQDLDLDLAILPETVVTSTQGPAEARAIPLDGPARDAFAELARKHHTYIIAPMELAEPDGDRTRYVNAAVLFDREGTVAGIYRKRHPVATPSRGDLEGGITPGREAPVFDCDFGKLGIQICWDIQFPDGWDALARSGAEIVAWPSASPATVLPATRAADHRYYVVSSTWRDNATIYEPTGMVAARVEGRDKVLVAEIDLSYAIHAWAPFLDNGDALRARFGDRVGYHYSTREDMGLFWSNDPATPIGSMIRSIGGEELDAQVARNQRLHDDARGKP